MILVIWDHFLGQGLTKTKCNFACTYPFMENLGTKLCLFDEINRLAGSIFYQSAPQVAPGARGGTCTRPTELLYQLDLFL